jgi:hypothetical protein
MSKRKQNSRLQYFMSGLIETFIQQQVDFDVATCCFVPGSNLGSDVGSPALCLVCVDVITSSKHK